MEPALNPDRWKQIDALYGAAVDLPPAERPAFLDRECAADPELRHELESLLAASEQTGEFLTSAHLGKHISGLSGSLSPLTGGTIGKYQVERSIGAGATGDVYLAIDPELGRRIAIKVLSNPFGTPADGLERFVAEARAASALNHPNIITVYEIGKAQDRHFIATEFIEGSDLRSRIASGLPIPVAEALDITAQAAGALAAAHNSGIIHRDIKPENIMLRPDGLVKVVDFGLALFVGPNPSHEPGAGLVMGTPRYMSPEQRAGLPLDPRTDVYSLGAVLAEMLGNDGLTDPHLKRIVTRAREADRTRRYPSAQQFAADLADVRRRLAPDRSRPLRALHFAAPVLLLAAFIVAWTLRPAPAPNQRVLTPLPLTSAPGYEYEPRIAPDGKRVAYTRDVDEGEAEVVLQEIGSPAPPRVIRKGAFSPAWSPTGDAIALLTNPPAPTGQRDILVVQLSDLSAHKLAAIETPGPFQDWAPSPYLDFSPDGSYLVASDRGTGGTGSLVLIRMATGEKIPLTNAPRDTPGDFAPRFSPDGRRIAFARLARFGASRLHILNLSSNLQKPEGPPREIASTDLWNAFPAWMPDGRSLVYAGGGLRLARLKLVSPDHNGPPVNLPVQETGVTALDLGAGPAGEHRIVYTRFPRNDDIVRVSISGRDPEANGASARPLLNSSFIDEQPVYSPDNSRIAFLSDRTGSLQLWAASADGSQQRQLTNSPSAELMGPVWSADGKRIAMQVSTRDQSGIFDVSSEGGPLRLLVSGDANAPAYTPDGQWLYFSSKQNGSQGIWRIPADGGAPQLAEQIQGDALAFTRDGKSVLFVKGLELFVKPLTGGQATLLFPVIFSHQSFVLTNTTVYAIARSGGRWLLMANALSGGGPGRRVAEYVRRPGNGIAVSADDRFALLTQRATDTLDLMLLDGVTVPR